MRALFFLFFLVAFSQAQAQLITDFYPVNRTFRSQGTGKRILSSCIAGDCKNGDGLLLLVRNIFDDNDNRIVRRLMDGKFADNGNQFSGKIYEHISRYNSSEILTYEPVETLDFSTPEGLNNSLYLEGDFRRESDTLSHNTRYFSHNYLLHGKGVDHHLPKYNSQYKFIEGEFDSGIIRKAAIIYNTGSPIATFSGWVRMNYELQFGYAVYSDSSTYIGAFKNNIFDGPGKYVNAKGNILEGTWKDGGLLVVQKTGLYADIVSERAMEENIFSYIVDGFHYSGKFFGKLLNGKPEGPGLISNGKNLFYSVFKTGLPTGVSFMKKQFTIMQDFYESCYHGEIKANSFSSGTKENTQYTGRLHGYYHRLSNSPEGMLFSSSIYIENGRFKNDQLTGCGIYKRINQPQNIAWDVTMQGMFENGEPKGWMLVTIPETKFSNYKESGYKYFEGSYSGALDDYSLVQLNKLAANNTDVFTKALLDTFSCMPVFVPDREKYLTKVKLNIQQMEEKAKALALKPKDPCAELKIPFWAYFTMGATVESRVDPAEKYWLQSWDCVTDTYYLLALKGGKFITSTKRGNDFREVFKQSMITLHVCGACKGSGSITYQTEETIGQEWEQVNFNLYIKSTPRSVTRWVTKRCTTCGGSGLISK